MKRIFAVSLLLCLCLSFSGCSLFSMGGRQVEQAELEPEHDHTVIRTLEDGTTTYYCWEDGIVTTKDSYNADSALFWENDVEQGAYVVRNSMGTVFVSSYAQPTQMETEPPTEATTEDPYQGHTLEGIVTDPDMGATYYCWDDGTVTTEEAYSATGLTWTHPWGGNFFNIYNGHSDNGNVIYSEKACTWCGDHKVFYLSYVRDPYDYTNLTEYLCESCHVDLVADYHKCYTCGCYYTNYWIIEGGDGNYYCELCWNNIGS